MKNPFEYGGVVALRSFCNRKRELQDLARVFQNGERLFMYSERRLGKTSLIKIALDSLDEAEYLPIYVDLWPTGSETDFALRLAKAITEATNTASSTMIDFAKRFFGTLKPSVTVDEEGKPKVVFGAGKNDVNPPDLDDVLEALPKIAKQTKKRLVVVLDEFQEITEYGSDSVEKKLRSAIQQHNDISYVFLGSRRHILEAMFVNKQRPLYRSAGHYPLALIATEEWRPFISEKFRRTKREISDQLINRICEFTKGHPFYTQHLCHAIWELTETNCKVTSATLDQALQLLLKRETSAFTMLWDSLAANQRTLLTALAVNKGELKPFSSDFVRQSGMRTASNVQRACDALQQKDLIDRDEQGNLYIADRFLRLWIQTRVAANG